MSTERNTFIETLADCAGFIYQNPKNAKERNTEINRLAAFNTVARKEFFEKEIFSSDKAISEVRSRLIKEVEDGHPIVGKSLPATEIDRDREREHVQNIVDFVRTEFVQKCIDSSELHHLVKSYNIHEQGPDLMVDVIRNQYCDKNTALLLFWKLEPYSGLYDYDSRDDIASYDPRALLNWDLANFIVDKVVSESYSAAKMPECFKGEIHMEHLPKNPDWKIPSQLFGEAKSSDEVVKFKEYDKTFSEYGPHCFTCKKPIESHRMHECPHCQAGLRCDCEYCMKLRGE